jgi:N-acetylglucosamine-6-phosphate deacetylase
LERERGALIRDARADMVALTRDLDVIAIWVEGVEQCWV